MKRYYEENNEAVGFPLTVSKDTALHIAVYSGSRDLLDKLLELAPYAYQIMNEFGNTALHEAAAVGNVEMAESFLRCDKDLLDIKNYRGETPLFRAAAFGRTKMVKYLASKVKNMEIHGKRNDPTSILHIAVLGKYFETALQLLERDDSLGELVDERGMTCLQLLANMPSAFKSGYPMGKLKGILYICLPDDDDDDLDNDNQRVDLEKGGCRSQRPCQITYLNYRTAISRVNNTIWECIAQGFPAIRRLWDIKKQQKRELTLAQILVQNDLTWMGGDKLSTPSHITSPYEIPLISAAKNGIIEIVEAILKLYPQAVEYINDRGENIFYVASRYRRKEILDLLQSPHLPRTRLSRKINLKGDSILHKAAHLGEYQLRDRPGDALCMQSDIQWLERVRKHVPPYFINHRNRKNITAEELFTIKHKKMVKNGKEWLMRTTEACTLVAVLIATVAFTCAYTIPGGSNSKTGHPLLLKETPFHIFTISDTLSLCFSLTSVVVFLSIMTSRMHEQDFRRSLPLKLVLGLTTLFFAVAAMMVAFAATLVLIVRQRLHWAAIPIYTIACCPVTIFLMLQFPLYLNIAWFTLSDMLHSFSDFLPLGKCMTRSSVH